MSELERHVLKNWPEDRLPVCAGTSCGRTIENGQVYAILSGTVKLLCKVCAANPLMRQATLTAMSAAGVLVEQEARDRRVKLTRLQRQRSKKIRKTARTVQVKPRGRPENLKRGGTVLFKYPRSQCRFCGEEFQPRSIKRRDGSRGPQWYCSVPCAKRDRRSKYITLVCPACDQEFHPKRGNVTNPQVCCSRSCARWWFPDRLKNPNPQPVRWSVAWGEACRGCGRTDRRHRGQGYCPGCYRKLRVLPAGVTGRIERAREPRKPGRTWTERQQRAPIRAAAKATG